MTDHESREMYLETILRLSEKSSSVRSIDVANEMGYSKPSVSRAVSLLKAEGFLNVTESGVLILTVTGKSIAESIYERHKIISRLLMGIGVSEKTALTDACRIEHVISEEAFDCIKKYYTDSDK